MDQSRHKKTLSEQRHSLSEEYRGTNQNKERIRVGEQHSLTGEMEEGKVRTWKESVQVRALTLWRAQREGKVRTWKEYEQLRSTHLLKSAEGGKSQNREESKQVRGIHFLKSDERWPSQNRERIPAGGQNSQAGKHRDRNKLEQKESE